MKRVLVTGASGFIGRHCLPLLVAEGCEVHAVSLARDRVAMPNVSWYQVDLLNAGQTSQLVARVRPDYLLHLAWYAVPGQYWESPENLRWVQASLELLRAFSGHTGKRVVVAGSCAEYGRKTEDCSEDDPFLCPTTLYGICKHRLQAMLLHWTRQTGVSSAWGRVFSLYGPDEHPSRVVAYVIGSLLRAQPARCSEGQQIRDFLHVEDVASAFVHLLLADVRGPVNIASGQPVSIKNLVDAIAQKIGRPDLILRGNTLAGGEAPRVTAATRRLFQEVGWKPHYDLQSGLDQTIAWWKNTLALRQTA
jgi:nucleoside-diphosphate-sugar epimerase